MLCLTHVPFKGANFFVCILFLWKEILNLKFNLLNFLLLKTFIIFDGF